MELVTLVQFLDKAFCSSLHTDALGSGKNSSVLLNYGYIVVGQTVFQPWLGNQSKRRKFLNSNQLYSI